MINKIVLSLLYMRLRAWSLHDGLYKGPSTHRMPCIFITTHIFPPSELMRSSLAFVLVPFLLGAQAASFEAIWNTVRHKLRGPPKLH
jgi:hypothetical protein